ncbi:unnamed protein product [Didymodactylos carnosus]|uniref:Uncharacterized protein n=1 Tax=Didymodactylos carnosus TaxID=1234261 RepID=A0A8S2FTU6_9BILA|nr:unnamed protein product [Didymodactylos carnosus]CAF4334208.1 unnamed protein product [Didymodactylos carnosus]
MILAVLRFIGSNIVRTLLASISNALQQSINAVKDGDIRPVISDHDLKSTNSVYYYLFLGRLSGTSIGLQAIDECDIFKRYELCYLTSDNLFDM